MSLDDELKFLHSSFHRHTTAPSNWKIVIGKRAVTTFRIEKPAKAGGASEETAHRAESFREESVVATTQFHTKSASALNILEHRLMILG